jgi:hypothetical protein
MGVEAVVLGFEAELRSYAASDPAIIVARLSLLKEKIVEYQ